MTHKLQYDILQQGDANGVVTLILNIFRPPTYCWDCK